MIEKISDEAGLSKKDARNVVGAVAETITQALKKGEKVTIVGFGTFQVMERKARRGVNPQTKEAINIPAKKVPRFIAGKELREAVG